MELDRHLNLLDQALGLDEKGESWPLRGKVVLIEDCVETSGAFVLHHLVKQALSQKLSSSNGIVIFISFAQSFSHYARILQKLGCNLAAQRDNKRLIFFDMMMFQYPDEKDEKDEKAGEDGFISLYRKLQEAVGSLYTDKHKSITIVVDDISSMEVSANGSSDDVLSLLHYFYTLTSEFDCTFIALNHEDVYLSPHEPMTLVNMEYKSDVLVRVVPLSTGSAVDVHGQLIVVRKGVAEKSKMHSFHFRIKENGVECFYPGHGVDKIK